jgi:hypothetical protein
MDVPSEVSPGKFNTLPEDLRARIIRKAGGGTVTRQHREYTIEDRIQDAGTKPFIKEEIEWLLNIRKTLAIMFGYAGNCDIKILVSRFNRDSTYLIETLSIGTYISDNKANISSEDTKFDGREEIDKTSIRSDLIGRYDTQIIKSSNTIVSYDEEAEVDIYADVVILDLRSIFIILKRRFSLIMPTEAINLARKYTMIILNTIMDDMNGVGLYALAMYLVTNAIMFDMDVNIDDYVGEYSTKNKTLNEFKDICLDLYNDISLVINNMV